MDGHPWLEPELRSRPLGLVRRRGLENDVHPQAAGKRPERPIHAADEVLTPAPPHGARDHPIGAAVLACLQIDVAVPFGSESSVPPEYCIHQVVRRIRFQYHRTTVYRYRAIQYPQAE